MLDMNKEFSYIHYTGGDGIPLTSQALSSVEASVESGLSYVIAFRFPMTLLVLLSMPIITLQR